MKRSTLVGLLFAALAARSPLHAQGAAKWSLALEAGEAEIQRASSNAAIYSVALDRRISQSGVLHGRLALASSSADEGFATATVALEVRPLARFAFTPIVAARVGFLGEPEYFGSVAAVAAAALVRIRQRLAIRFEVARGTHDGEEGPHAIVGGIEFTVGK